MASAPRLIVQFDVSQVKGGAAAVKKALAEIGVSAEQVDKAMDKTSRSVKKTEREFSSLERKLDPVTRRTNELARAKEILDRKFALGNLTQQRYNELLSRSQQQIGGMNAKMQQTLGFVGSYAAGFLSIGAAIQVASAAFKAWGEQEQATLKIEASIRRLGATTDVTSESAHAFADAYSRAFAFADEEVLNAERTLMRFGVTSRAVLEEATGLSGDLARELGIGIQEAASMLGKALQAPGEGMKALKSAGLDLSDAQAEMSQQMADSGRVAEAQRSVMMSLEAEIGGAAGAATGGVVGATRSLTVAWGELSETLGKSLSGEAGGVLGLLTKIADAVNIIITKVTEWSGKLNELLGPLKVIRDYMDFVANPIGSAFGGVIGSVGQAPANTNTPDLLTEQQKRDIEAVNAVLLSTQGHLERIRKDHDAAGKAAQDAAKKTAEAYKKAQEEIKKAVSVSYVPEKLDLKGPEQRLKDSMGSNSEFNRMRENIQELSGDTNRWVTELRDAERTLLALGPPTAETVAYMAQLREKVGEVEYGVRDLEDEWQKFADNVQENFLRGVQGAISDFIYQSLQGGDDALKNFGKGLKDLLFKTLAEYLAQWIITQAKMLAASLKRIATEAAAQKAANSGSGGTGGGMGMGSWGSIAKMFGGSGTTTTTATGTSAAGASSGMWAAAAAAAVVVAFAAWRKYERDQASKVRYGTTATLMEGQQGNVSGWWMGKLDQTGQKAVDGLRSIFEQLSAVLGTGLSGMERVTIKIRNDKKGFDAFVGQEMIGRFRSLEEATIAAAKKSFTSGALGKELDAFMVRVIQGFSGKDPEALAKAITSIQKVRDVFMGISEMERSIMQVRSEIEAFTRSLIDMGVRASEAREVGMMNAVNAFRGLWEQLSGKARTPEGQKEQAERSRKLLLAQMQLYSIELRARMEHLRSSIKIVQMERNLDRQDLMAQAGLAKAEIDLNGDILMAGKEYLRARGQLAGLNVDLMNAELQAIANILTELDKMIDEVSVGKIKIGNIGGGRSGGLGGGANRLTSALERLISAVNRLREFQQSLKQDEQLSPLTMQSRYNLALADFQRISSLAQGGNLQAIEDLPDASRQLLELASQMFGTAGGGYQSLFNMVNDVLQRISDQYPQGDNLQRWLRSDMVAVKDFLARIRGDGDRRSRQHDQTNAKLDILIYETQQNNQAIQRAVSTQPRPGGGPRNGGTVAA